MGKWIGKVEEVKSERRKRGNGVGYLSLVDGVWVVLGMSLVRRGDGGKWKAEAEGGEEGRVEILRVGRMKMEWTVGRVMGWKIDRRYLRMLYSRGRYGTSVFYR